MLEGAEVDAARAEHGDAKLVDDTANRVADRLDGGAVRVVSAGGGEKRTCHGKGARSHGDGLGAIEARSHASGGDRWKLGRAPPAGEETVRGAQAEAAEDFPQASLAALSPKAFDGSPGSPADAGGLDGRDSDGGRPRGEFFADARADLLDDDRQAQASNDALNLGSQAAKVGVPLGLDGLLQRVEVQGQGVELGVPGPGGRGRREIRRS